MSMRLLFCALLGLVSPLTLVAQARTVSAPAGPSLVDIARQWSRASQLGDLREGQLSAGDVEVRAWTGFGIAGTHAVRLRREGGLWRAWRISMVSCSIVVPRAAGDTASRTTRTRWEAEARAQCGDTLTLPTSAHVISVDTLAVVPINAASTVIESAWTGAVQRGMLILPPLPAREMTFDGVGYVVEVRQGPAYRASVIQFAGDGSTDAERQMLSIMSSLAPLTPQ